MQLAKTRQITKKAHKKA